MEWIVSLILFILLIIAFFLLCKINKKKKELEEEQSNQFLNYYNQHINGIEEKFNQRFFIYLRFAIYDFLLLR